MRTYASMRGSNPRDLARPATAAATEGTPITARGKPLGDDAAEATSYAESGRLAR